MFRKLPNCRNLKVLVLLVGVLLFGYQASLACTVNIVSLRREFRNSKRVFIGEVVAQEGVTKDKIPTSLTSDWNVLDKITLRVKRAWKGPDEGIIAVYSNVVCDCPHRFLEYKVGREFIVFADEHGFADACSFRNSETVEIRQRSDLKADVKRLDSFWFRTWATIYPF